MKGFSDYMTKDGVRVIRVHYSADEDKDMDTPAGKQWLSKALRGYPGGMEGAKWRREMEIDFNAQGGQLVFPHMEKYRERIYIAPFEIPDDWKLYGGFDYAGRGTTAFVVVAHDKKNDDYYLTHEFYKRNSGYVATCEAIKKHKLYDRLEWIVADPSVWAKTQERAGVTDLVSMAQLFSEQGVHFIKGTRGGDTEFAELINEQMWGKLDNKKGAHSNPRYRIFQSCKSHWSEMSQWRYAEWANVTGQHKNVKETMIDKNNHSIDAAKYVFKMLSTNWMAEKVDSFDVSKHIVN